MSEDDAELVASAQAGDTTAFAQLLRRHDDAMRGVAWRVVGSAGAMDDVLQEAYLDAWRGLPRYRGDAAFSSWLYRIVHRSSIDWVRSQRPTRSLNVVDDGADARHIDPSRDPGSIVAETHLVRDALATLPPDQLAVVTLIDGQGMSYDHVAEMLDVSAGTIASRLHRARAAVRAVVTSGGSDDQR